MPLISFTRKQTRFILYGIGGIIFYQLTTLDWTPVLKNRIVLETILTSIRQLVITVPILIALAIFSRAFSRNYSYTQRIAFRKRQGPSNFVPYTEETVSDEYQKLRNSYTEGITRPLKWRKNQLWGLHDLLREHTQALCAALQADLHRNPTETLLTEIITTSEEIKWLIENLDQLARPTSAPNDIATWPDGCQVYHDPHGVVAVIGPFNFPLLLTLVPLAGSIAGGNCCMLKLSENSSHVGHLLTSLLPRYLDTRCLSINCEGSASLVQALLSQPIDFCFFTGSRRVGSIVAESCGRNLCPFVVELGGKSPAFLDLQTANLRDAAKKITWVKTLNSGQICVDIDYLIIVLPPKQQKQEEMVHSVIKVLKQELRNHFGSGDIAKSDNYCRIVNKEATVRLERLIHECSDCIVEGGRCDPESKFVEPTILLNPPVSSQIMKEEIFGPVLPILVCDSLDSALSLANSIDNKPLATYVFSQNLSFQQQVLNGIHSGGVGINDVLVQCSSTHLPFGGCGKSGIGSYHGKDTFKTFTQQRSCITASWIDLPIRYPHYSSTSPLVQSLYWLLNNLL